MRQINEQAYVKDGVAIQPGEKVLFVSRSHSRTQCRLGTYLGTDSFGNPVVKYPGKRWYWKSRDDHGFIPCEVTVSLPCRRVYGVKHFEN